MTTEQRGNSKGNNNRNGTRKSEELVHKYSGKGKGPLRESVIITGIPYFIRIKRIEKRNDHVITIEPFIEESTKRLRPPFLEECPYCAYEFKNLEDPNRYLQRIKTQTIDTLYEKIKNLVSLFNDIDKDSLHLLSANILGSYFQDRCSTVHYLFVLGDNGTGKSVFGDTFECLGYRAVNITNATESFWFRIFGNNEPGQVTVIAEEFDRIDEKSQVMGMLKEGYHPNAKVPRMNNDNTKMEFFLPFGFKIMIAERSPNEDKAKGLLDRSLTIKTYKGFPKYDIKEVRNPQGNIERAKLFEELMDLRKMLLIFKLLKFKTPLPEVDIGLQGRDKELCKPLLQLFLALGASPETISEIENAMKHFLDIKNNRKEDSNEALVYPIVANVVSEIGIEVSTAQIWDNITRSVDGYFDKYVDKDGKEYIRNPNTFYTSDYGTLNRNSTIKMIRDKFGAEMKHKEQGNVLVFNPVNLVKAGKIYGKTQGLQTKLVPFPDPSDSPDALTSEPQNSYSILNCEMPAQDFYPNHQEEPVRAGESDQSGESVSAVNLMEKCPMCDYIEHPFFLKIHIPQCPNACKGKPADEASEL